MPPIVVARQWPPMNGGEPGRHDRDAGVASLTRVLVITATRLETRAARSVLDDRLTVLRVGVGGRPTDFGTAQAIISVGLCGALDASLAPGDVVIPDEIGSTGGPRVQCAPWLVDALRSAAAERGDHCHRGPLLTVVRLVTGAERAVLAGDGWAAADMESAWLSDAGIPMAAVRVVLDTPAAEIDPAWERPLTALLRPRLWGQARRLAEEAPRHARLAAEIVGAAFDRIASGAADVRMPPVAS
jgi:4-hydroxy-3-methylbut-2-enyl diphosphate reductase